MTKEKEAINAIKKAKNAPSRDIKVRVTTMLDGDILEALKEEAKIKSIGYQTLLNQKLRESIFGENGITLEGLAKKIADLEKKVG
jgi:uncharacterized protein (DUF4415 family)